MKPKNNHMTARFLKPKIFHCNFVLMFESAKEERVGGACKLVG